MNIKKLKEYAQEEMTIEARIKLKQLWVLEEPEMDKRDYLSKLIMNYLIKLI